MAAAPHRRVDGNPPALIVYDGDLTGHDARDDSCRKHNRACVDDLVSHTNTARFDGLNGRRHVDVGAAPAEHVRGDGRELLVDLGEDSSAGFEQLEADLLRADPGIEAQDVVHEGRELPEQLDTDEPPADHDDRQASPS